MLGTANGAVCSTNPSIPGLRLPLTLAFDSAFDFGPRLPRRGRDGSVRRMTRRMRVSSRTYTDVRQANPGVTSRTRTASSYERGIRGGVFLVTFSSLVKKK